MYKILANSLILGKKVIVMPSCHSTNLFAERLVMNKQAQNGTVVVTNHQLKGMGQENNAWESEPGQNLTLSVIVEGDSLPLEKQFYLNIISTLAVYDTITFTTDAVRSVKIKWPNDVLYNDSKVSGILIKNLVSTGKIDHAIIGIGLNVNQTDFSTIKATSLNLIKGEEISLEKVFEMLITYLDEYYHRLELKHYEKLKEEFEEKLFWKNEVRRFITNHEFEGKIRGIDQTGRLLIETREGIKSFNNKELVYKIV